MDLDRLLSLATAIVMFALFLRGLRAYREIRRIYHHDPESEILATIHRGTLVKVAAAAWFGTLTTLAILGIGPFPILRPISLVWACLVLDLPSQYLKMIRRIQDRPPMRPIE